MTLKSFIETVMAKRIAGSSNATIGSLRHYDGTVDADLEITVELDNSPNENNASISHGEEVNVRFINSQLSKEVFSGAVLTIGSMKYQYFRTREKFDSHTLIVFRNVRRSVT